MDESNCEVSVCSNSSDWACLPGGSEDDSIVTNSSKSARDDARELEEEARLIAEEAALQEELKKQYEERLKKEEKEQRYKRLMHLLSKSQFYSSFLLDKLEKTKGATEKNVNRKGSKKSRQPELKENMMTVTDKDVNVGVGLRKNNNEGNEEGEKENELKSPATHSNRPSRKRKANALYSKDTYNISDVISKEDIEIAKKAHIEKDDTEDDLTICENNSPTKDVETTDEGRKTKITSLGLEVPIDQPDLLEGGILRDYQMEGVSWLKLLFESGMNGILADEMGLGKTIQIIAHICFLIERNVQGPFLIVAPLSTLSNWDSEFERFAPQVPVVIFHGSNVERKKLYGKLNKTHKIGNHSTKPVIITSYEVPLRETAVLARIEWQYIIVDEGHRIKNYNTLLSRVLRMLVSKNRLLLTGTPLQNNLTELWSLLNFLLPELFDDLSTFEAWFDLQEMDNAEGAEKIIQQEREQQVISTLHQILFPFLLRRMKIDVEMDLPPKKEVMVFCPMTPLQIEMYKVIVDKSLASLLSNGEDVPLKRRSSSLYRRGGSPSNSPSLSNYSAEELKPSSHEYFPVNKMPALREFTEKLGATDMNGRPGFLNRLRMQNAAMVLRHIVNHPYLVRMPIRYNQQGNKILHVTEDIKNVSGKLLVLDAMLAKLKERGHKVLIFCTSTMMLDILEEYVILSNYEYRRLDGACKFLDRKKDIYDFNTDPEVFIFLLSTRAGGLGINLTGADTVILYNSDWNPQADLQAQDRAHRIGQVKPVVVYRFNVACTVDDKIITRASSKRKLEKIVMKNGAFNLAKQNDVLDLQELREMLKSTDTCKAIQSNGFIFTDEELEDLLDRSDLVKVKTESDVVEIKTEPVDEAAPDPQDCDTEKISDENNVAPKKKLYEVLKLEK